MSLSDGDFGARRVVQLDGSREDHAVPAPWRRVQNVRLCLPVYPLVRIIVVVGFWKFRC